MTRSNLLTLCLITLSAVFVATGCDDDTGGTDAGPGATDAGPGGDTDAGGMTGMGSWGDPCTDNDQCGGPTDFCVINPMMPDSGYCSVVCSATSDCAGSGMDWSCNAVGTCMSPPAIWCGPRSEIAMGMGVIMECM